MKDNVSEVYLHLYDVYVPGQQSDIQKQTRQLVQGRVVHTELEVYGRRWWFGEATDPNLPGLGFSDRPKEMNDPGFRYSESLPLGTTKLTQDEDAGKRGFWATFCIPVARIAPQQRQAQAGRVFSRTVDPAHSIISQSIRSARDVSPSHMAEQVIASGGAIGSSKSNHKSCAQTPVHPAGGAVRRCQVRAELEDTEFTPEQPTGSSQPSTAKSSLWALWRRQHAPDLSVERSRQTFTLQDFKSDSHKKPAGKGFNHQDQVVSRLLNLVPTHTRECPASHFSIHDKTATSPHSLSSLQGRRTPGHRREGSGSAWSGSGRDAGDSAWQHPERGSGDLYLPQLSSGRSSNCADGAPAHRGKHGERGARRRQGHTITNPLGPDSDHVHEVVADAGHDHDDLHHSGHPGAGTTQVEDAVDTTSTSHVAVTGSHAWHRRSARAHKHVGSQDVDRHHGERPPLNRRGTGLAVAQLLKLSTTSHQTRVAAHYLVTDDWSQSGGATIVDSPGAVQQEKQPQLERVQRKRVSRPGTPAETVGGGRDEHGSRMSSTSYPATPRQLTPRGSRRMASGDLVPIGMAGAEIVWDDEPVAIVDGKVVMMHA